MGPAWPPVSLLSSSAPPPGPPLTSRWCSWTGCSYLWHLSSRVGTQEASLNPPLGLKFLPLSHWGWSQAPSVGQSARSGLGTLRGKEVWGANEVGYKESRELGSLSSSPDPPTRRCPLLLPLSCKVDRGTGSHPQKLSLSLSGEWTLSPATHPPALAREWLAHQVGQGPLPISTLSALGLAGH